MLRSWIERVQQGFAPKASAGVIIGRNSVGFARLALNGGRRVESLVETRLDKPLFMGAPSPEAAGALVSALQVFAGELRRRYVPVHVSVPDAAVRLVTFEFDQLPTSRAAQLDLVRFRFKRESVTDTDICECQALGCDGDKHLLLGLAMNGGWQGVIKDALGLAGITAWSLNTNACRQFNRFHDRLVQTSGALVTLTPDAWSLWLWDTQGRLRYARSRWRSTTDDHGEIATDVERSILAYVYGHQERSVASVYVAAGGDTDRLASLLDSRSRQSCICLAGDDSVTFGASVESGKVTVASSISAALEQ